MAAKVDRVKVECPKCGHPEALRAEVTFYVSFSEEDGDEVDDVRAVVFKCAKCGHIWAVFPESTGVQKK